MFDYITCKSLLPINDELRQLNIDWQEREFQTKELDNCLCKFVITEDGTLIENVEEYEYEYYSKEEAKQQKPWNLIKNSKLVNSYKKIIEFHGKINFYDNISINENQEAWVEFNAYFIYGKLDKIELANFEKRESRNSSLNSFFEEEAKRKNSLKYKFKKTIGWFWFWKKVSNGSSKLSRALANIQTFAIRRLSLFIFCFCLFTINCSAEQRTLKFQTQNSTYKVSVYEHPNFEINVTGVVVSDLDCFYNELKESNVFTTLEVKF